MYATPTYLNYGAHGAASVPREISSLAGKIIGIPGGDTLYILPSPVQYVDPRTKQTYTAPTHSIHVLKSGPTFLHTGMYFHADDRTYEQAANALRPFITNNDYMEISKNEWAAVAGPTGAKLPEGTTSGTSLTTGGSLVSVVEIPSSTATPPKKRSTQSVSRAPAGLRIDKQEPWKSPLFWLFVVSGTLVVGGVGYAVLKE